MYVCTYLCMFIYIYIYICQSQDVDIYMGGVVRCTEVKRIL